MSKMVRTRADNRKFEVLFDEFNIKLGYSDGLRFIDRLVEITQPEVIRSGDDVIHAAWEKMREAVAILEEGMDVNPAELMRDQGLDPSNRSDATRTREFLKESGLLQYNSPKGERWVRIGNNGSTAKQPKPTAPPPTTEAATGFGAHEAESE
jgi:hypothetical protein